VSRARRCLPEFSEITGQWVELAGARKRRAALTTLANLLGCGYLPDELPPAFGSKSFAQKVAAGGVNLLHSGKWSGFPKGKEPWSKPVIFYLARPDNHRRRLSIPNPMHYQALSEVIEADWTAIEMRLNQCDVSLTYPINGMPDRAIIPKIKLKDLYEYRADVRSTSRYLIKADISQCYASIYTHSIPWALHGKAAAKAALGRSGFGDDIDKWIRCGQDGQTKGIPIGPDCSHIVAEIVLTLADEAIKVSHPKARLFRWRDDYEISCQSLGEAEAIISSIHAALDPIELSVNPLKTAIVELPTQLGFEWEIALSRFDLSAGRSVRERVHHYFDLAYRLAAEHRSSHVLKFALSRLYDEKVEVPASDSKFFQDLLLQTVLVEPGAIALVVRELQRIQSSGHTINADKIGDVVEALFERHSKVSNSSEVAWALWAALYFDIKLQRRSVELICGMDDPVVALLALDAHARKLMLDGWDPSNWIAKLTGPNLWSEYWLLAYEAVKKKWLSPTDGKDYLAIDPYFSQLQKAGVEFYDPTLVPVPLVDLSAFSGGGGGLS
jgi:hypothetical protein